MIGSEHLSHMLLDRRPTGGRVIGEELTAALRRRTTSSASATVRAHAILGDDLGVYREVDGEPVHDFTGVDRVYDHAAVDSGLRPVVELSFMPHDLASDPTKTVFDYARDRLPAEGLGPLARPGPRPGRSTWSTATASTRCVEHWSLRGLERGQPRGVLVRHAARSTCRLYDVTAAAVRRSTTGCVVGGPSLGGGRLGRGAARARRASRARRSTSSPPTPTAARRWTSGRSLARYGREGTPIWWTEWGVTPTHFNEVSDARVRRRPSCCAGWRPRWAGIEALSYWVVSDHFEELGRPPALLHGGFGLRTVGELRKPRWWALALLERLRPDRLGRRRSTGDGAGSLVEALASRSDVGAIGVLAWNLTLDQTKAAGSARPGRPGHRRGHRPRAGGVVRRPPRPRRRRPLRHRRRLGPDQDGDQAWPDDAQWATAARGRPPRAPRPRGPVTADDDGTAEVTFDLPMPSMSFLRFDG